MRYYHRGQQYSVIALTDSSANVVERYAYNAYGTPTITDAAGAVRSSSGESNRYLYTGREWDSELSLYHYRARMYDSVIGRFLGRDPIGYTRYEFGLFGYVGNSPAVAIDPLGNDWLNPSFLNPPEWWPHPQIDHESWLEWWNMYHGNGDIDTLSSGCIGVAGTVCGHTDIEEFKADLTNCYRSQAKANAAAEKLKCNGCKKDPSAVVAIQFSGKFWTKSNDGLHLATGDADNAIDQMAEPISVNSIWAVINNAMDAAGNPLPTGGHFDFQVQYGGCWFGANHGASVDHPDMQVLTITDIDAHIKKGEQFNYNKKLWCAMCRKCEGTK